MNIASSWKNYMWSNSGKFSLMPKKEVEDLIGSSFPLGNNISPQDIIDISLSSSEDNDADDDNDLSTEDASNQLVLYDPLANGSRATELVPNPPQCESPLHPISKPRYSTPRVLPSVGAFTVQCANCFKWRLIPTEEKYEEIREHILEQPFSCDVAREWRPNVSCDDPEDISQDGSRLWAIDKPSIAQPPPGWQRLLRIRGEGSSKFADIYYIAPSGKRLRSMVEIQKYLLQHPEYTGHGLTLSRFSFQIPRPLQDNYVRKRPARVTAPYGGNGPAQAEQANPLPLSRVGPADDCTELHHGRTVLPAPSMDSPTVNPFSRPAKKQATQSSFQGTNSKARFMS
ncbi:methyl-CpG-binding domain-containing protein 2 isoform X2 [Prosopis cineraria]|uniref:methyl-CpG-binding domain-containing protein 2 isoform X2 n=1 Tax=Prosopis cineraria TaxID=364024 RepID=UPI00240F4311|nr:methyl-CpG-binding domain-containing protein 2 isoform X2 [Prosopis cineraria]